MVFFEIVSDTARRLEVWAGAGMPLGYSNQQVPDAAIHHIATGKYAKTEEAVDGGVAATSGV